MIITLLLYLSCSSILFSASAKVSNDSQHVSHKLLSEKTKLSAPMVNQFLNYASEFSKEYMTEDQLMEAATAYHEVDQYINEFNANANKTSTIGHNMFSDWTQHQKKSMFNKKATNIQADDDLSDDSDLQQLINYYPINQTPIVLEGSINWTEEGAVGPVQDQGLCGSCWAFTTAGLMESAYYFKTGNLIEFSPQQLVSCSSAWGNEGCGGGNVQWALQYLTYNKIVTNSDYPYVGSKNSTCTVDQNEGLTYGFGLVGIQYMSPSALKDAVNGGPVGVAIAGGQNVFQYYTDGIITDASACGTEVNHAVQVVGYGTENGISYWLVKNQWGADWGLNGYAKIGVHDAAGVCAIQSQPEQPLLMQQGFIVSQINSFIVMILCGLLLIAAPVIILMNRSRYLKMQSSATPSFMLFLTILMTLIPFFGIMINFLSEPYMYLENQFWLFIFWLGAILVNPYSLSFNMANNEKYRSNGVDIDRFKCLKAVTLAWPMFMILIVALSALNYFGYSISVFYSRFINCTIYCIMLLALMNLAWYQIQSYKDNLTKNKNIEITQLVLTFVEFVLMIVIFSASVQFPAGSKALYGVGYPAFNICLFVQTILSLYGMMSIVPKNRGQDYQTLGNGIRLGGTVDIAQINSDPTEETFNLM